MEFRLGLYVNSICSMRQSIFLCQQRSLTTGNNYTYNPGFLTWAARRIIYLTLPNKVRKRIALKMFENMQEVRRLEKEQLWMIKHDSPLKILGLPAYSQLSEVRQRYRTLLLETHPDVTHEHKEIVEEEEHEPKTSSREFILENKEFNRCKSDINLLSTIEKFEEKKNVHTESELLTSAPITNEVESREHRRKYLLANCKNAYAQSRIVHQYEYELIQEAYKMATDPSSLWHRNGAAPELLQEIKEYELTHKKQRMPMIQKILHSYVYNINAVHVFALLSVICGLIIVVLITSIVYPAMFEGLLQIFDNEFYRFMKQQEADELGQKMRGEQIDNDPKRLAPHIIKKMSHPGRYIHEESEEEFDKHRKNNNNNTQQ